GAAPTTILSSITVSGVPYGQIVDDITVNVNITHAQASDVQMTLIAPDGTRVRLVTNRGGGLGANFVNTTLSDSAPTSIAAGVAPFSAAFQPEQPLSALNGKNPNGIWFLEVKDSVPATNNGTLTGWSITFTEKPNDLTLN